MNFELALTIAARALTRNRERSLLTILGIVIGVAAVIVTVAIGAGAKASIQASIAGLGTNMLVLLPGNSSSGGVNIGLGGASTLTINDGLAIVQQVRHVAAVTPAVQLRAQVVSAHDNWQTQVIGASPAFTYIRNWQMQAGSFFSDTDVAMSAKVAVLGTTVAENLFPGQANVVGETVAIRNVPFRVIGVLVSHGHNQMGMDQDDDIVIPYSALLQRLSTSRNGPNVVGALLISIDDEKNIAQALDDISALLRVRHRIVPPQVDDFQVRDLADIARVATSTGMMLQILLASVATVSLIVGGIGIMNIMLVSVTERTREIGLRMAVGAPNAAILLQFLVEAALLSTAGGALGALLGVALSAVAAAIGHFPFTISLPAVCISLAFSAAIGLGFGFYPARKAAQLDPIIALHAE